MRFRVTPRFVVVLVPLLIVTAVVALAASRSGDGTDSSSTRDGASGEAAANSETGSANSSAEATDADEDSADGGQSASGNSPGTSDESAGAQGATEGREGAPATTTPSVGSLSLDVSFARECIRAGEAQVITIRTEPGAGVAYHAIYSDGKNARDPDYYGGNRGGLTDPTGRYTDTWTIGPAAPPGEVHVDVIGTDPKGREQGYVQAFFEIAGQDRTCG